MAKNITTLYIDDASLRQVVTRGEQVKVWAELPLESGLVESSAVIKKEEVAARIKQLFKAQKVGTKKVIVGMSGLHSLTRPITLPQIPTTMLDEAVRREARRTLPVPLEELYVSWQSIPAPSGKTRVFLTAIPRKAVDALLMTLRHAGVKTAFMDLKPLLLARVVREATAVIVDVQTNEFDIVVMADGIPQPIRSVAFASDASTWQQKLAAIKNDLGRTITFYNSTNPDKTLAADAPIFVAGDLAGEAELCKTLSNEVGHPVLPLPSPLQYPKGFTPNRFMVNIGLALQRLPSGKAGPSLIKLNALPVAYQPKPISFTNIFGLSGAAIVVGLLAILLMLTQGVSADISSIRNQLTTANKLIQQSQLLTGNITKLQKSITDVQTSRDKVAAAFGSLEKQGTGIKGDLDVILKSLLNTVTLRTIAYNNNVLTVDGQSASESEVLSYLKKLDTSRRFGEISVTNMGKSESGVTFAVRLSSLPTQSSGISSISVAIERLPSTITLINTSASKTVLTLSGTTQDEDTLMSYVRDLQATRKFRDITITNITKRGERIDFSLVIRTGD